MTTDTTSPSPVELKSAVLFLVFNRPDVTARVFDAIRNAKPPRLYIAADGPRKTKQGEATLCDEVKKIVANVDWPCTVKTLFRNENLGCRKAVSSAITWFFDQETEGIIIEDDVLPSPEFFRFCDFALNKYRTDTRIGMVTGNNLLGAGVASNDYMYSQIFSIWGWATWKRAWDLYDSNMDGWPSKWRNDSLNYRFKSQLARYFSKTFDAHVTNNIDTWDTQWLYTCIFNNFLCVTPKANMISNIGIVGTHSSVETPNNNVSYGCVPESRFKSPSSVGPDPYFDAKITKRIYRPAHYLAELSHISKALGVHSIAKYVYSAKMVLFKKLKLRR